MAQNCENFRSLSNTEIRNGTEDTDDTTMRINTEVKNQGTMKVDEMKRDLNLQIMKSINSPIHETILPSLQSSLSVQNSRFETNVDSTSSRQSRNTERIGHKRARERLLTPIQSIPIIISVLGMSL